MGTTKTSDFIQDEITFPLADRVSCKATHTQHQLVSQCPQLGTTKTSDFIQDEITFPLADQVSCKATHTRHQLVSQCPQMGSNHRHLTYKISALPLSYRGNEHILTLTLPITNLPKHLPQFNTRSRIQ